MNGLFADTFRMMLCLIVLLSFSMAGSAAAASPAGTYVGTYSGGDYGTVSITIDDHGAVDCDFFSTPNNAHYLSSGGVSTLSGYSSFTCASAISASYIWSVVSTAFNPGGSVSGIWDNTINGQSENGSFTAAYSSTGSGSDLINPAALTGVWYDPQYSGSGFNVLMSGSGLLVTYYGWDARGNRLWLTSDVGPNTITPAASISLNMTYTTGGTFTTPQHNVATWGTLDLTFTGCSSASATLKGTDGTQTQNLQLLAGALDAPTCVHFGN